jgi:hypothetical protein
VPQRQQEPAAAQMMPDPPAVVTPMEPIEPESFTSAPFPSIIVDNTGAIKAKNVLFDQFCSNMRNITLDSNILNCIGDNEKQWLCDILSGSVLYRSPWTYTTIKGLDAPVKMYVTELKKSPTTLNVLLHLFYRCN